MPGAVADGALTMRDDEDERICREAGIDVDAELKRVMMLVDAAEERAKRKLRDFKPWWIVRKAPMLLDCISCGIEKPIRDTAAERSFVAVHSQCREPTEKGKAP